MCVCVHAVHTCGNQATLGSQFFLSTMWISQESNLGWQPWQQAPLPTEPSRWPQLGRFEARKIENFFISSVIFSYNRRQLLTGFPFLPGILGSVNYDEETDHEEEEGDSPSSPSAHSEKESSVAGQKAASVRGAEPVSFCSWVIVLKRGEVFTPRLGMLRLTHQIRRGLKTEAAFCPLSVTQGVKFVPNSGCSHQTLFSGDRSCWCHSPAKRCPAWRSGEFRGLRIQPCPAGCHREVSSNPG